MPGSYCVESKAVETAYLRDGWKAELLVASALSKGVVMGTVPVLQLDWRMGYMWDAKWGQPLDNELAGDWALWTSRSGVESGRILELSGTVSLMEPELALQLETPKVSQLGKQMDPLMDRSKLMEKELVGVLESSNLPAFVSVYKKGLWDILNWRVPTLAEEWDCKLATLRGPLTEQKSAEYLDLMVLIEFRAKTPMGLSNRMKK